MIKHESREDYLEAILVLRERWGFVRAADIAQWLGVSKASVSKAVGTLKRAGLATVVRHDVRLTTEGHSIAQSIRERHLFFRALLMRAGVEEKAASEEACRLEHCLSEESFGKLVVLLRPLRIAPVEP